MQNTQPFQNPQQQIMHPPGQQPQQQIMQQCNQSAGQVIQQPQHQIMQHPNQSIGQLIQQPQQQMMQQPNQTTGKVIQQPQQQMMQQPNQSTGQVIQQLQQQMVQSANEVASQFVQQPQSQPQMMQIPIEAGRQPQQREQVGEQLMQFKQSIQRHMLHQAYNQPTDQQNSQVTNRSKEAEHEDVPRRQNAQVNISLQSTAVPPNNALLAYPKHMNISTSDYIQNILRTRQSHQTPILQPNVNLPKNKLAVNAVPPTPQLNVDEEEREIREAVEMIEAMEAEDIDEVRYESPPPPPITDDTEELRTTLNLSEEDMARQVEMYRQIVESNTARGQNLEDNDDESTDSYEDISTSEEENEELIMPVNSPERTEEPEVIEVDKEEESTLPESDEIDKSTACTFLSALGSSSTTPLSLSFMDQLGQMLEERKKKEEMENMKVFDDTGKPITTSNLLSTPKTEQEMRDENAVVYIDQMTPKRLYPEEDKENDTAAKKLRETSTDEESPESSRTL